MDSLPVEACLYAALLTVWCGPVRCEPSCGPAEFLHPNGSCAACPACGPGEQLSEDCGFGDVGEGVCTPCEEGTFSADTGVAPCVRCTRCRLLHRQEKTACSPAGDAQCRQCLAGYYELRSLTGEAEPSCVPCSNHDMARKECLHLAARGSRRESAVAGPGGNFNDAEEESVKEETVSVVLIGSATASSIFLVALLLWAFLLTAERFKQVPAPCPGPEGRDALQYGPLSGPTEGAAQQSEAPPQTLVPAQDPLRGLNAPSQDVHPTSIVINVTTNVKPSSQREENLPQEEQQSGCYSTEEMEQKLQAIWEVAQGQSIELLDYDSVQDLSLLLDSSDNRDILRRLGRSLGVPPRVITHVQGFQDLFQYLRTSTFTLLPQLAQAAALLPNPEVVARIHRAVVTT